MEKIRLTSTEKTVFNILQKVNKLLFDTEGLDKIDDIGHGGSPVSLLVAGGWVRDKIMGHNCRDLDFISSNKASKFIVTNLKGKLEREAEKKGQKMMWLDSEPILLQNPLCKNQELLRINISFESTKTGKKGDQEQLENFDLDLREIPAGETYAEDTKRRDFKMNALYYDFVNEEIVDLAGVKGNNHRE